MDSDNITDPCEDNRNVGPARRLRRSTKTESQQSSFEEHTKNFGGEIRNEDEEDVRVDSRSKTRTWRADPDQDQVSDEEGARSRRSFSSDDGEKSSPSEGPTSLSSPSQTPSPTPAGPARGTSSSALYRTGRHRRDGGREGWTGGRGRGINSVNQ